MTDYRALCADSGAVSLKHTGGWRAAAHPDLSAIELVWSCPPVRLRVGAGARRYPDCGAAYAAKVRAVPTVPGAGAPADLPPDQARSADQIVTAGALVRGRFLWTSPSDLRTYVRLCCYAGYAPVRREAGRGITPVQRRKVPRRSPIAEHNRQMGGAANRPIAPMLATLGAPPLGVDERWAAEFKWDGCRIVASTCGDSPVLWSRSGSSVGQSYPEVVEALDSAVGRRQSILVSRVHRCQPQASVVQRGQD